MLSYFTEVTSIMGDLENFSMFGFAGGRGGDGGGSEAYLW